MSAPIPDEQAALLAAIVAEPDADAPRLVYADWLQEHGDEEQAGFIRDSIKLSLMKPKGKTWKALRKRLRELADQRRPDWYGPLGINDTITIDRYHRGFPFRVTFESSDALFAVVDTVFAFVPIRGLEIQTQGSEFDNESLVRFAATPGLSRITDLRMYHHSSVVAEAWGRLFCSPHLSALTRLDIANCGLYEPEAVLLAAAAPLANLTELDLSFNSIGVDGLQALLNSPHLTKLKALWLDHNFFGDEDGEDEVLEAWEKRLGDGLHIHESPDEDEETV